MGRRGVARRVDLKGVLVAKISTGTISDKEKDLALADLKRSDGWALLSERLEESVVRQEAMVMAYLRKKDYEGAQRALGALEQTKQVILLPDIMRGELSAG